MKILCKDKHIKKANVSSWSEGKKVLLQGQKVPVATLAATAMASKGNCLAWKVSRAVATEVGFANGEPCRQGSGLWLKNSTLSSIRRPGQATHFGRSWVVTAVFQWSPPSPTGQRDFWLFGSQGRRFIALGCEDGVVVSRFLFAKAKRQFSLAEQ